MKFEKNVKLYIVYNNQSFKITEKNNKNHLQLRTDTPLWHKENMINIGNQNFTSQRLEMRRMDRCGYRIRKHTMGT